MFPTSVFQSVNDKQVIHDFDSIMQLPLGVEIAVA